MITEIPSTVIIVIKIRYLLIIILLLTLIFWIKIPLPFSELGIDIEIQLTFRFILTVDLANTIGFLSSIFISSSFPSALTTPIVIVASTKSDV